MNQKKFSKLDFKKFHPSGSLGKKLKTVEDLMIVKNKIPFIDENSTLKKLLKLLIQKNLVWLLSEIKKRNNRYLYRWGY